MRLDPRQHLGRRVAIAAAAAAASLGAIFPGLASAQAGLGVSAEVTGCSGGASVGGITCQFAVAFGSVSGATSYTAEVTRPGGTVQSFNNIGPGSATLPVTYTGNGEYVVTIKAYGDPAGADEKGVIAKDRSR